MKSILLFSTLERLLSTQKVASLRDLCYAHSIKPGRNKCQIVTLLASKISDGSVKASFVVASPSAIVPPIIIPVS